MRQEEVKELLKKYSTGTANAEERALVEAWYEQYETQEQIINEAHLQSIEDEVFQRLPIIYEKPVRSLWPRIAAAASILLFLSIGGYYVLHKKPVPQNQVAQNKLQDLKPGRNQATLTLANGKQIVLYKGLSGKLAQQGNTLIQVNGSNAIAYTVGANDATASIQYNTLTTKNGEQSPYPLVLADGSKVWLNAASSITFPTAFVGNSREVKITGEAYFEVAHNAAMPFRVNSNGQTVEVLGTHFDIKAYTDEAGISTTLLEGKVRVSKNNQVATLKPGQQSFISFNGHNILVKNADTEIAMAWHNGLFKYNLADIKTVMRDFARWYDVDIQYEGRIPNKTFTGELYRDINASEALQILSLTKVHFRIDGKKIIVTPN